MTIGRDELSKAESVTIAAIESGVPLLVEAREIIASFQAMVRRKSLADLEPWLERARSSFGLQRQPVERARGPPDRRRDLRSSGPSSTGCYGRAGPSRKSVASLSGSDKDALSPPTSSHGRSGDGHTKPQRDKLICGRKRSCNARARWGGSWLRQSATGEDIRLASVHRSPRRSCLVAQAHALQSRHCRP